MDTLLDVSRLTEGRLRLDREELDLTELVRSLASRLQEEIKQSGSALELRADARLVGSWDRLRLEEVAQNLLSNALKYGQGQPIEIAVAADGAEALLTVRDHGIGIPEEARSRIFQRFERFVSRRHFAGFGLGLWIVRQIVEAHGGHIEAWSEPGEGSLFTVHLPIGPHRGRGPPHAEPGARTASFRGRRWSSMRRRGVPGARRILS